VWASRDGGATWTRGVLQGNGSDQSTAFDRHGTAYFECEQAPTFTIYRSTDGGVHWSSPVVVASSLDSGLHLIDRPFLAVDDSGGPRDGTVYAGWESFFTDPITAVYLRSSRDGGRTWGPVRRVDSITAPGMWDPRQYPVVGAGGTLYQLYDSGNLDSPFTFIPPLSRMSIVVARSDDGGLTFRRSFVDRDVVRSKDPFEAFEAFAELIPRIAADPRRAGHVAVAWPDSRSGESRILVSDSIDGGRTWNVPIDAADDPPGHGNQHDHVAVTFLPDGRLVVVWRDRRAGGGGWRSPFGIFARVFTLGPRATLVPGRTVQLTTSPQPPANATPAEYLDAAAGPWGLSVAWDQQEGKNADSVYRRLPLPAYMASRAGTARYRLSARALAGP
jgi:hypothetical protein